MADRKGGEDGEDLPQEGGVEEEEEGGALPQLNVLISVLGSYFGQLEWRAGLQGWDGRAERHGSPCPREQPVGIRPCFREWSVRIRFPVRIRFHSKPGSRGLFSPHSSQDGAGL